MRRIIIRIARPGSRLRTYLPQHANAYFWRTYEQQEIDLIMETQPPATFGLL